MNRTAPIAELIAGLILACLFAWLASQVTAARTLPFDLRIRDAVHQAANPSLTAAMRLMSFIGEPYVVWPLTAVVFVLLRRIGYARGSWLLVSGMLGGLAIEQSVKFAIRRPRPHAFFGYPLPGSYSFPSGHALSSFAFCGLLAALLAPRLRSAPAKIGLWTAAFLTAGAIGFSRIYLGVHYPTDVIGGYTGALAWLLILGAGNGLLRRGVQSQ